jgi:hypothetical protein
MGLAISSIASAEWRLEVLKAVAYQPDGGFDRELAAPAAVDLDPRDIHTGCKGSPNGSGYILLPKMWRAREP